MRVCVSLLVSLMECFCCACFSLKETQGQQEKLKEEHRHRAKVCDSSVLSDRQHSLSVIAIPGSVVLLWGEFRP